MRTHSSFCFRASNKTQRPVRVPKPVSTNCIMLENGNRMASIVNMEHVYGCFYLSFQTPTQLAASLENLDNVKVLNVTTPEGSEMQALLSPTTLEDIYGFYCLIKRTRLASETSSIVLYAGPIPRMQATCAFLLGCYMMLSDGLSVEDTRQHFEPLNCKAIATFESRDGLTLEDFWGAIHRARWSRRDTFRHGCY